MIIKTYPLGVYEENIYVLVDEKSKDACIVDPGGHGNILIKNIEELNCNVKYILLTHGHFDHVEALNEVAEKFNAFSTSSFIKSLYFSKNSLFKSICSPYSYLRSVKLYEHCSSQPKEIQ